MTEIASSFTDWSQFAIAAASIGTFLAIAGGSTIAVFQLFKLSDQAKVTKALNLLRQLQSSKHRAVQRLVFSPGFGPELQRFINTRPPFRNLTQFNHFLASLTMGDPIEFREFHAYLARLETVSMLALHNAVPDDIIWTYFRDLIPHHRNVLQPYLRYARSELYGDEMFLQHFEILADMLGTFDFRRWENRRALRRTKKKRLRELSNCRQVQPAPPP